MKTKILLSFTLLISLILFCKTDIYAEALPSLDSSTYELIDGGSEQILNLHGAEHGIWSILPSGLVDSVKYYLGIDPYLKPEDYHIRPLSVIERENLNDNYIRHFYDRNGNEIELDNLYYVTADNGYYSAEFYIDSNGQVLFSDPQHTNVLLNIGLENMAFQTATGSVARDWNDVLTHLSVEISQNNFNFSPSGYDLTNYSYLVFAGTTSHGHASAASYLYISNQYNPGVTVPVTSSGYINQWYTNYPETIIYKEVYGSTGWLQTIRGEFYRDNILYNYKVIFANGMNFANASVNNNFNDWVNGINPYQAVFGLYGQNYNQYSYEHSFAFYSLEGSEMPDIVENEMYDYNELQLLQPDLDQSLNPDFDPSLNPVGDNVPTHVVDPFGNQQIFPSDLPLPGSNPDLNPIPQPSTDDVTDITQATIGGNIPILENLKNRFPFSIPWDLKRIIRGLNAQREAPNFHWEIFLPVVNYSWEVDIDFSMWNNQAAIFRNCFLILFIISLATFAYKHYFGS